MNSLDVIFLIIIIIFSIRGLFRGLITEFIVLTALILGYVAAFTYLDYGIVILIKFFPKLPEFAARVISFVIIFLIINIILRSLGKILNQFVKYVFLKSINRLAGAVFGMMKIVLIISLVLILIDFIPFSGHFLTFTGAYESQLYQPVKSFAPQVYRVVISIIPGSSEIHQQVIDTIQQADSTARSLIKPF